MSKRNKSGAPYGDVVTGGPYSPVRRGDIPLDGGYGMLAESAGAPIVDAPVEENAATSVTDSGSQQSEVTPVQAEARVAELEPQPQIRFGFGDGSPDAIAVGGAMAVHMSANSNVEVNYEGAYRAQ